MCMGDSWAFFPSNSQNSPEIITLTIGKRIGLFILMDQNKIFGFEGYLGGGAGGLFLLRKRMWHIMHFFNVWF